MITNGGAEKLDVIISSILKKLHTAAARDANGRPWISATLDERITENDFCSVSVWYVKFEDGTTVFFDPPYEPDVDLVRVREIRHESFTDNDKFFGILFTVYPDGKSEVKFDYDPDCSTKIPMPPKQ